MARPEQVRELVAAFLMLPPANVGSETSLATLANSLGEAKLRLGLKRLGLLLPPGVRPATFGDLDQALSGKAAVPPPAPVPLRVDAFAGLRVGLDLQDMASLPAAADYWEDAFYTGIFAPSEIAYAVLQSEPRTHFAGFWCAKEALRKCDPSFAAVDPTATAVAHEASGRPYFLWRTPQGEQRLPHALSISHAAAIAMAIVAAAG